MFEGSTKGRKLIVSVSKAETNGIVRIAHLQSFHRLFKINIHVSPGNPKFGSSPFSEAFSSSAWKTLTMLRRRDDGSTFLPCETLGNTDGTLSTATSWLMLTDCGVQSFTTFQELGCPTSHWCVEMRGYKACTSYHWRCAFSQDWSRLFFGDQQKKLYCLS